MADVTMSADATMAEATVTPDAVSPVSETAPQTPKQVEDYFKQRIEASKRNRRQFYSEWKRNVELRIGRIASQFTGGVRVEDEVQTEINPDWSLTKTKTANLFSQVPTVRGSHENKQYKAAVAPFMKELNYQIGEKRANVGVCMEEVLNDVVNAAGIGAVVVGYAARFESVVVANEESFQSPQGPVPTKDLTPEQLQQLAAARLITLGQGQRVVSDKFFGTRISPTDLLTPEEFVGSNFDDGDWIGFTGRKPWAEAKNEWKLTDDQKQKVLAGFDIPTQDDLRSSPEKAGLIEVQGVKYDELYYWRYKVDSEELNFKVIWKIVFVHGLDTPVVHEPWKGQRYDDKTRKYVGSCKFPVRVLTLTYITDNPIPPSDSSAGRPQVNDMRRSRSQMFQNRERSVPIRWFDVNRIDPAIQDLLMKGTWQGMIPTNGDGTRTIGEIARASYPSEDLAFDVQTKNDLMETWQIGANQLGSSEPGRKTAGEAGIVQQNFATRIGQERGRVASFFLGICEVMAGLIALYGDFQVLTDEERQTMQGAWDSKAILHDLVLKIRPDSTIMLDVKSRLERLTTALNLTAKSGYVNVKPIIEEILELSGIDSAEVVTDPAPKKPEDPNISFRFTGKDDLMNPLVVALLIKAGLDPTPAELDAAKKLLEVNLQPPKPPAAPEGAPGAPGAPGPPPPGPAGQPGQPSVPHPQNIQREDWSLSDRIAKRSRDIGSSE